jgi:hypothetical protein
MRLGMKAMDQLDFDILTRIESGKGVFRPAALTQEAREAFQVLAARIIALRDQGLIRLLDSRIARNTEGLVMIVGPCDLTHAGREALERDRRLGPRP